MQIDAQRRAENFALSCPLKDIEDADMLAFLATLIQDHDHLREKLLTEPNREKRGQKLDGMRAHLGFRAASLDTYEQAELARRVGVQPFYAEAEAVEKSRIWMPPSFVHEVRG